MGEYADLTIEDGINELSYEEQVIDEENLQLELNERARLERAQKENKINESSGIKRTEDEYWIRFGDSNQSSSFTGSLKGKYLFFSGDQALLIKIAEYEIEKYKFQVAKVSTKPNNKDYVLCLYWTCDTRKYELAQRYKDNPKVKYRYWKSNEKTRRGQYSDEFNDWLEKRREQP